RGRRPLNQERQREDRQQCEAEDEIGAGEDDERGASEHRLRDRARLRCDEAATGPGQPRQSRPKLTPGAGGQDVPDPVGELLERQAAAGVLLSQRDRGALAVVIVGEHGRIVASLQRYCPASLATPAAASSAISASE